MIIEQYAYGYRLHEDQIRSLVGKFNILQRVKMGGSGSPRSVVEHASPNLFNLFKTKGGIVYANMDLRPSGVMVVMARDIRRTAWVIPFDKLVLFKSETLNIQANGEHLELRLDSSRQTPFINKLLQMKRQSLKQSSS